MTNTQSLALLFLVGRVWASAIGVPSLLVLCIICLLIAKRVRSIRRASSRFLSISTPQDELPVQSRSPTVASPSQASFEALFSPVYRRPKDDKSMSPYQRAAADSPAPEATKQTPYPLQLTSITHLRSTRLLDLRTSLSIVDCEPTISNFVL